MADVNPPKVAIITGAASGIGEATVVYFLEKGYQVLGVDVNDMDMSKVATYASSFAFHKTDIAVDGAPDKIVADCLGKFGRVDVLANVAGIMDAFASADTFSDEEWNRVMDVNLNSPVRLMRAVLKPMKEQKKGAIVNVCSKAGVSGGFGGVSYTASKHGLVGATKNVAFRFRNEGIRCNCILPGGVQTNMSKSMNVAKFDAAAYAACQAAFSLQGVNENGQPVLPDTQPRDIASAIYYLACDESRMINGACLPVDKAISVA